MPHPVPTAASAIGAAAFARLSPVIANVNKINTLTPCPSSPTRKEAAPCRS